jgi:hypothetical protein
MKKLCHRSSRRKIIAATESMYIANHHVRLETEFSQKVLLEDIVNCNMIFRLLSRIPNGIDKLLSILEDHVINCGKIIMEHNIVDESNHTPSGFIFLESLMVMHTKFMKFCKDTFSDDASFTAAVDKVIYIN